MKQIKVLVGGCCCNQKFSALVQKVVKENGIEAEVKVVSDIMEVMQYDVMTLPAIIVDEKVVATGQKEENEIIQILKK